MVFGSAIMYLQGVTNKVAKWGGDLGVLTSQNTELV